jgi:hypothetical protein
VAGAAAARFADPLPVFNPPEAREQPTICLLTNMCPLPESGRRRTSTRPTSVTRCLAA